MLIIERKQVEHKENKIRYVLQYPVIRYSSQSNQFIKYINKRIYEDIICFEEVSKDIYEEDNQNAVNLLSEYTVMLNEKNIISILIEFNQFIGLNNINYINTYNYDLNLEKEIKLVDIFDKDINYKDIICEHIKTQLRELLEDNSYENILDKDEIISIIDNIEIYSDQLFYIFEDGIIICFSKYEMGNMEETVLEFKIKYEDIIEHLSEYFIESLLK